jgi:hypothetical protein
MITYAFSQPDQQARKKTHSSQSGLRNLGFRSVTVQYQELVPQGNVLKQQLPPG